MRMTVSRFACRCRSVLERFWHELHDRHTGHGPSDGGHRAAEATPTATLRLDINFDAIKDRAQFFEEVKQDLSKASKLKPEQIRILDLRAGSTIVEFSVPDTQSRSASDILNDLKQQLKHPGSPLMTGKHTKKALDMTVRQPALAGHQDPSHGNPSANHAHGAQQAPAHGGHHFDIGVVRQMFKDFETDKSGRLKINGLTRLAERLWEVFHPKGPKLEPDDKEVLTPRYRLSYFLW
jgi:hypothetical protein